MEKAGSVRGKFADILKHRKANRKTLSKIGNNGNNLFIGIVVNTL